MNRMANGTVRNTLTTIANRMRDAACTLLRGPPGGRIVTFDPNLDAGRSILTKGITFPELVGIINRGNDGDITDALSLFEEMERSDTRLASVANTRRFA